MQNAVPKLDLDPPKWYLAFPFLPIQIQIIAILPPNQYMTQRNLSTDDTISIYPTTAF